MRLLVPATPAKYITDTTEHFQLQEFRPKMPIRWKWLSLSTDGLFIVQQGYPTDGPSGPTFDTKDTLKGAVAHDGLCQLSRQGFIDGSDEKIRDLINAEADAIWDAAGMAQYRTEIWEAMLDRFGDFAFDPKNAWKIIEVP